MEYDKDTLKKALFFNTQKYTYNRSQYLKKNGYEVDKETSRQIWNDYGYTIKEVISYITKELPDGFLYQEGSLALSFAGLSDETRVFIDIPSIDCTIMPVNGSKALMSFEKGILRQADSLETVPGLPTHYQTSTLNRVLEGRNIYEIRDMFKSLGVLPNDSLLDVVIEEYAMRVIERKDFCKAVIETLLLSDNVEDITRAYLFDYFMGINFDFEVFKNEQEKRTK